MKQDKTTPTNTIQKGLHTQGEWWHTGSNYECSFIESSITKQLISKVFGKDKNQSYANAELIVKSVNEYPKLIEVVKELHGAIEYLFADKYNYEDDTLTSFRNLKSALQKSKEILP